MMKPVKFQVLFQFDSEYGGYVADVPELPECMSQGKTLEGATANVRDAITGYFAVLAKHGTPFRFRYLSFNEG